MKKSRVSVFVVISILLLNCFFSVHALPSGAVRISIAHTNDIHARADEGRFAGMGYAKLATLVRQLKMENPNTLVLDAGDTFHGQTIATLGRGESIVEIMNAVGYDAMVAGNHDFNYGYERLLELESMADFPVIAANVFKEDGSHLLTPFLVKEVAGVKIGIFGLATPETVYKTHPNNVRTLVFSDPGTVARQMVDMLKPQTDVIIALAHLGMDGSSTDTSIKVASNVKGIDLIVDGHSHDTLPHGRMVAETLIVSAGEYSKSLGIVDVYVHGGSVYQMQAKLVSREEVGNLLPDSTVTQVIEGIKDSQKTVLSQVIGRAAIDHEGDRTHVRATETNLGNLIADVMLAQTGADCAITNGGGIRDSIAAGEITKGHIIEVLPFGNFIMTKRVSGRIIRAALEHGVSGLPSSAGSFPQVAGLAFTVDTARAAGERIGDILIQGKPLIADKEYILATNDFLAAGGDNYTMLLDGVLVNEYSALDEALIEYIQSVRTISTRTEGRITIK